MNVVINICILIIPACAEKTPSSNINLFIEMSTPNINCLLKKYLF